MNAARFIRKCLTDRPAAWRSLCLVGRSLRGRVHWWVCPGQPLRYRLPEGGWLWLEADHSFTHCFWPGVDQYEPDVRAALWRFLKPGDVFVDCGANIGYFSVLARQRVGSNGRVLAIEANPQTCRLLQRNLEANGYGELEHCALTTTPGEVQLYVPRQNDDVYSSLQPGGLVTGDNTQTFTVTGKTLDTVIEERGLVRLDLVKLDIEGAELQVLESARRLLRRFRPVIICEYGTNTWPAFGATQRALLALLDELNYRAGVFDVPSGTVRTLDPRDWQADYLNLVLEPEENLPLS